MLSRLLRLIRLCKHDGPMFHLRSGVMGDVAWDLWKCDKCGAEILVADQAREGASP